MTESRSTRLSAPLKWGLAGTLLATLGSLLWPTHELVEIQDRDGASPSVPATARQATSAARIPEGHQVTLAPRPPAASGSAASAAAPFDPFVGLLPPAPPAPPSVAAPVAVAPPPAPPQQDYRYLGRVTNPDGVEQVLLVRGDAPTPIKVGTVLDNGYVVESISLNEIVLVYPPLAFKTTLAVSKP